MEKAQKERGDLGCVIVLFQVKMVEPKVLEKAIGAFKNKNDKLPFLCTPCILGINLALMLIVFTFPCTLRLYLRPPRTSSTCFVQDLWHMHLSMMNNSFETKLGLWSASLINSTSFRKEVEQLAYDMRINDTQCQTLCDFLIILCMMNRDSL
jgi:hypothetical protein